MEEKTFNEKQVMGIIEQHDNVAFMQWALATAKAAGIPVNVYNGGVRIFDLLVQPAAKKEEEVVEEKSPEE